ncbi:MAG: putative metal-binding motif-containing protein [Myxococcota bacterium]|nr:putative metal-binding motif-containing protein [Myxococcota bacterium]
MNTYRPAALVLCSSLLAAIGCGDGSGEPDAAIRDGGPTMDADPGTPCTRDLECDDGLFCTVRRCVPGDDRADSRGCVTDGSPCGDGEMCSEAEERCSVVDCTDPDADNDGHDAIACGGGDCDDADFGRHPSLTEVCDAEGHDEDCDPETLGGPTDADVDGDGYVSAGCCFGATCGDDCDDDDGAVNPGAAEICNGVDDDCSGAVDDETSGPLCPGGTCDAGRCSFRPWDRIMGNLGNDFASAVSTDSSGNVYVVGSLYGGADFGAGPEPPRLMVSYTADGALRWTLPFAEDRGYLDAFDVHHYAADGRTVAVGNYAGEAITLAGTTVRPGARGAVGVLFAVRPDGTPDWLRELPSLVGSVRAARLAVSGGELVVVGSFEHSFDFAGSTVAPVGDVDGFVARFRPDGTPVGVRTYGAAGATVQLRDVSVDAVGALYFVATFRGTVDFGAGPLTSDAEDSVVFSHDASGLVRWVQPLVSPGFTTATAVTANERSVFVSGRAATPFTFGGGGPARPENGFVVGMSAADGSHEFTRGFQGVPAPGDGYSTPYDVSVSEDGDVIVVGGFYGTVGFGAGGLSSTMGRDDIFIARFSPAGVHVRDRALGGEGFQIGHGLDIGPGGALTIVGRFAESVNLGSGARTTGTTGTFGFVGRLD